MHPLGRAFYAPNSYVSCVKRIIQANEAFIDIKNLRNIQGNLLFDFYNGARNSFLLSYLTLLLYRGAYSYFMEIKIEGSMKLAVSSTSTWLSEIQHVIFLGEDFFQLGILHIQCLLRYRLCVAIFRSPKTMNTYVRSCSLQTALCGLLCIIISVL